MEALSMRRIISNIELFMFDLDGTLYRGDRVFEASASVLDEIKRQGKRYLLLTNNSSKSSWEYHAKLRKMGLPAGSDEVYTSTMATMAYLKRVGMKKLYVLAMPSVKREFEQEGFVLRDDAPDAVVLCFDLTLTYEKIYTACRLIMSGSAFVATHPDVLCPSEGFPYPDCGAISRMITAATGAEPTVLGKPNKTMVDAALAIGRSSAQSAAMVGDRLNTDMEMGYRTNLKTILVLSGVTSQQEVNQAPRKPDIILESVADLLQLLGSLRQ